VEKLIGSRTELTANERDYLEAIAKRWQDFAKQMESTAGSRVFEADGHTRVAELWLKLGRRVEASQEFRKARDLYIKLVEYAPGLVESRPRLATTHEALALVLADLTGLEESKESSAELQAAMKLRQQLVEQFPDKLEYQKGLIASYHNRAMIHARKGRDEPARLDFSEARKLLQKLSDRDPKDESILHYRAAIHLSMGQFQRSVVNYPEAKIELTTARDIYRKLWEQNPNEREEQFFLALAHSFLGAIHRHLWEWKAGQVELDAARDILQRLADQFPAVPMYRENLARATNGLGILYLRIGQMEKSRAAYQSTLEIRQKLVADFPNVVDYQIELAGSYCNKGELISKGGALAESLPWFGDAERMLVPIHTADPNNATAKEFLRNVSFHRAKVLNALKKYPESLRDWDRTIELTRPEKRWEYCLNRVEVRYSCGLLDEAVEDIASFEKKATLRPEFWFTFGSICAEAADKYPEKNVEYADRAMALLTKAVNGGYKDSFRLNLSPKLKALRSREDFKALVQKVGGKPTPKSDTETAPPPRESK